MKAPRAAVALYVALALHALLLLGLALRPPSQDAAGPGRGIGLSGSMQDLVEVPAAPPPAVAPAPVEAPPAPARLDPAPAVPPVQARAAVSAGGSEHRDAYLSRVRAHLAAHRRELPAGTGGGRAQVALRIAADGSVSDVRLLESSGLAPLDAEALDLVRRASPLPPPPAGAMRVVMPLSIGPS